MEREIQKPADPLYNKAKCAAGESMAGVSSMLGQLEGANGGTTHRPYSQELEVTVCAELNLRLQARQPTNSSLIPDRCKNSFFLPYLPTDSGALSASNSVVTWGSSQGG
jgi:hypothetical protein